MKKITPFTQVGLKWTGEDGRLYHSVRRSPATIEIIVSTFRGISAGAKHYYATIEASRPEIYSPKEGIYYFCGGYGPNKPVFNFSFNVYRTLNSHEYDAHGASLGGIGERTTRFQTTIAAIESALDFTLKRFTDTKSKKWQLKFRVCEDYADGSRVVRPHGLLHDNLALADIDKIKEDLPGCVGQYPLVNCLRQMMRKGSKND